MIIVVANSKGGVGKSTLAVHLAAWLHQQGHSVTLCPCWWSQAARCTANVDVPTPPLEFATTIIMQPAYMPFGWLASTIL